MIHHYEHNPSIWIKDEQIALISNAITKIGKGETISLIKDIWVKYIDLPEKHSQLEFINQGFSNTVVLKMYIGEVKGKKFFSKKSFILKIGKFDDVSQEINNYRNLINYRKNCQFPELVGTSDLLERWGCILYEDIGASVTFFDFYNKTNDLNCLKEVINNIFVTNEETWYKDGFISSCNLLKDQFNLIQSLPKYRNANKLIGPDIHNKSKIIVSISGNEYTLTNPIEFLVNNCDGERVTTHLSIVHGDFHSGNILIDELNKKIHLVDFANMQSDGHIFKDYVKLEANLLLMLYEYDHAEDIYEPEKYWFELAAYLLGITTKEGDWNSETIKVLTSIKTIRKRACDLKENFYHSNSWQSEYLIGLLHWVLSSIYWIDVRPCKKRFAFYYAAMICTVLESKKILIKK